MARLVKEWMKAKKGICSSDCECLTITGWRCYAEEHLCNCGDSSAPVPPVPPTPTTYTYSLEKTSTRGLTVTYTATKTPYGESTPVGVYKVQVEYEGEQGETYISIGKVGDCTSDCVWREPNAGGDEVFSAYINQAELALVAGTQEAFESVYNAFVEFYTTDPNYMYYCNYSDESDVSNYWDYFKIADDGVYDHNDGYSLYFDKDEQTGEVVQARIIGNSTSDIGYVIDMTYANGLSARSAQAAETGTQTAFKAIFDEAETLYHSFD